jgi:hypothetical protein
VQPREIDVPQVVTPVHVHETNGCAAEDCELRVVARAPGDGAKRATGDQVGSAPARVDDVNAAAVDIGEAAPIARERQFGDDAGGSPPDLATRGSDEENVPGGRDGDRASRRGRACQPALGDACNRPRLANAPDATVVG